MTASNHIVLAIPILAHDASASRDRIHLGMILTKEHHCNFTLDCTRTLASLQHRAFSSSVMRASAIHSAPPNNSSAVSLRWPETPGDSAPPSGGLAAHQVGHQLISVERHGRAFSGRSDTEQEPHDHVERGIEPQRKKTTLPSIAPAITPPSSRRLWRTYFCVRPRE
ncbi:hypothetical protein Q5P01_000986 [Channa striata]|uniref:Uncharacterized protein n=1 Tax=Channa striata TaxID=64152 RepID=A0AA88LMV2_CHASR|nr:hypothetical protein Q5P01_000986 [Channa striata]